ncbi:MAG: inosine/xanthosine triphosphatase [Acidobacteriota bacterium]|nr:inosine/xanthosine triphosphatase [Acidobacteriota bacterium]
MISDLKNFWQRLQTGVEVAVAGPAPDKLLGVRDGLQRFFYDGLGRTVSVAVVPQTIEEPPLGLLISDEEVVRLARQRALDLERQLSDHYHFYVASEGGLHSLEVDGRLCYFVRNWTVVRGLLGEAWGSSGSIQLPDRIVAGLDSEQLPFAVPGTRRSGGMISSLTSGLESRRQAVAASTLHAVSTLFYGVLESRPGSGRP